MILRVDSISIRRRIRWSCLLFLFVASIQWAGATALAYALDARVASVQGTVLRRNKQRAFILARGDLLNPGDEIDTRGGGRVAIELTDGSVVVVHPNSRIVISDYRAAPSLREMFRILVGRVRIKIAHYGGKPNPYRVNSPTASILVRGTEFGVAVESSGDTTVVVYDGLVEVQSLSDPRRRALLSKGRGALVKPNEDIRLFTPGSGNRSDERGARNDGLDNDNAGNNNADNDNADNASVKTNTNASANANASPGANANGNANGNANASPGANANGNANGNANASPGAKANGKANGNANASPGANSNGKAKAKRDDVGGGVEAAGKYAPRSADEGLTERENVVSGEVAAEFAARRPDDDVLERDDVSANAATNVRQYLANDYERHLDSLAGRGWSLPLRRFAAFADSHFDSLDNPAYLTVFTSIEGRAWLIPFFNKARGGNLQRGSAGFPFPSNLISPFDSGLRLQGEFFIPLDRVRMVIGGAVAVSTDQSQSLTMDRAPTSLIRLLPKGGRVSRYVADSTESASITGTLMAARRFGDDGRTSVGAAVEWVSGGADLRGQTLLANSVRARAIEDLKTESQISRFRFRLGMTREFVGGHKLGMLYSQELAAADDRDRSRLFNGLKLALDSTRQEGRFSEVSFRLRGPLTRRLFYGLEGSLLWGESDGQIRRAFIADSTTRSDLGSAGVSFGLGFALRRTTVLSADFAFGRSSVYEERREDATGDPVEDRRERERYVSAHAGLQTDVWRQLFASASALVIGEAGTIDLNFYPDLFGRRLTTLGLAEPGGRWRENSTNFFSDFGAGWRLSPKLVAEYIFSIDNGQGPPRHIFLLRYTFKREK